MVESKRSRVTGRQAPSFSLAAAIEMAEKIKLAIGRSPAARELVAKALGHQTAQSGTASVKIGTLTHFGLLERAGREKYMLSALGLAILYPHNDAERIAAIAEAAKTPALYRELTQKFEGHALPTMLPNILAREFHVADKKTKEAATVFEESMTYAGLLKHGVLQAEPEAEPTPTDADGKCSTRDALDATEAKSAGYGEGDRTRSAELRSEITKDRAVLANESEYQIILSGNRFAYLRLPSEFSASDLNKVEKWIAFNRDDLVTKEATDE